MGSSQSQFLEDSVHDFVVQDNKGNDVHLNVYRDRVLLIVNVATNCGLTNSNYTQLSEIYSKYKTKGLEILAFPCNQFLRQEPLAAKEVEKIACDRFNTEFPILHKVRVNGPTAAPVYKFLKSRKGGCLGPRIKWNFTKFLVDKEGHVIARYSPMAAQSAIERDIEKALNLDRD